MASFPQDSQDPEILRRSSERYQQPIMSLHAPTLFFLQRLWGGDAWIKIERTVQIARELGVPTVVAHPPFRWQGRSEEHTSELQSRGHLVCRLLLEKKKSNERSMKA